MENINIAQEISEGKAVLGIELGSTRIKAVLIDSKMNPVASGDFNWESVLSDGIWTYSQEEIHAGVKAAYSALKKNVAEKFGVRLSRLKAMGVSAMMHGYLAFDKNGRLISMSEKTS